MGVSRLQVRLNENARDPVGSLAFHHEELAVLIGCCAFRLPLGQPATRAAVLPFGLAFCWPPTCVVCQPSGVAFQRNLRLNIGVRSNGQPSCCSAACAAEQPSGPTFRPICDSRRRPTFRLRLSNDLRPSPPADPPAMPSDGPPACAFDHLPARPSSQPPAFAFDQPSGPAIQPNLRLSSVAASASSAFRSLSSLRLRSIFQPNLPTSLQLAPSIDLPAQPLRQPATCAAGLFSD